MPTTAELPNTMLATRESLPVPWHALADGDRAGTISGLGLWLAQAFFLPGDLILWALLVYAPPLGRFLELGPGDYGGVLSGFLSALSWLTLLLLTGMAYNGVRDFDRVLTQRIATLYTDTTRRARIAWTLERQRWARESRKPQQDAGEVEEVALDPRAMRVLRAHSELPAGAGLAPAQVAVAAKLHGGELRAVLAQLVKLRLMKVARRGGKYELTPAGRAFLVFQQLAPRGSQTPVPSPKPHG